MKLTPYEYGMYFEQISAPDSTEYNRNLVFRINGVSKDNISTAVKDLMAAHEAFHSRYGEQDGVPVRMLTDSLPVIIWKTANTREEAENNSIGYLEPFDIRAEVPVKLFGYELPDDSVILHMAAHHIAFDGVSDEFIADELFARLKGDEPEGNSIDLSDISEDNTAAKKEKGTAYYRKAFSDGIPSNDMPVRASRPSIMPEADSIKTVTFVEGEVSEFEKAARTADLTTFAFLFGAISIVIGKYCGSEDIVLGVPANMRDKRSGRVIGMFANMAPVRVKPVKKMPLAEYLRETSLAVKDAAHNYSLPFSELVDQFVTEHDGSRHPVFDVSVNYLHMLPVRRAGGISLEYKASLQKMKRDITITIRRFPDQMELNVQYSSKLYDDMIIDNMLDQIRQTLKVMCEKPEGSVTDAAALPKSQADEIEKLSSTAVYDLKEVLLHKMFEKAAAENPGTTALIARDRTLTFSDMNTEANIIARNLLERGITKGSSVVLLLPRKSFYFTALFGVLKAGACFIPCDPEYPTERINRIVGDSGAGLIITDKKHLPDYPADAAVDILSIKEGDPFDNPDVSLDGDDLAYMIYTSGSTGIPKGVMLTHAGISNFCTAHPANILYDPDKSDYNIMVSVTTVSFDLSLKDTLGILVNGKTVVFADEEQMNDPKALTELIISSGSDAINATPSRYLQYMEYPPFVNALSSMRLLMAGGENFPEELLSRLQKTSSAHIINTYGPTETTVSVNMADLTDAGHVTVGRPLLNVREFIVDSAGNPVPKGVKGELLIGGPCVAKGYKGLDEQTKERFTMYRGIRVFRSGDHAKWDPDGKVRIIGRIDGQVKLRGLRIEPGEIESVIEQYPGINRAVAAVKNIGGKECLVGYYVSDEEIDKRQLRAELKKVLTAYMIPLTFVRIPAIPLNANGKTDRKVLPVPDIRLEEDDRTKPHTDTEKRLYELVRDKAGTDGFGINTEFSMLGFTSLTVVGLMLSVSEVFNKPISIPDIKNNNTVALLAAFIEGLHEEKKYELRGKYPLTQTQYGIYVECLKNADTTIYNIPLYIKLHKSIDLRRLKQAICEAVDAHPYLKTRLSEEEDSIYAVRNDRTPATVKIKKTAHLPCAEELIRPYDLLNDELYRMEIFEAPEGNSLYMELHHIIGDGESRLILQHDIERAYAGESLKTEEYTGYEAALKEEEDRQGKLYEEAKTWYEKEFSDVSSATLPPAMPEKTPGNIKVKSVCHESALSVQKLKEFCRIRHITLNTLFNAAYGYTLGAYAFSDEAVFTTIYNGRGDSRLADSVTMLVHTLPVRLFIMPETKTADYLDKLHEQLDKSMQHCIYSFGEISRAFGIKAETMLAFQGEGMFANGRISFCGQEAEVSRPELSSSKTNLTCEIYTDGDRITLRGEYAAEVYCEDFVRGFLKCLEKATDELTKKECLKDISLMYDGAGELYEELNRTDVPVKMESVNRLFERQAASGPDRIAVIAAGEKLTFGELNESANRVAHSLIDFGIHKDSIVGMVFDRTKEIFITEGGILKAGGAFLPMVSEYPDTRIEYCLKDAQCPCVITTSAIKAARPDLFSKEHPYITFTVEELLKNPNTNNPDIDIPMDSLAYCIYTSGSTGNPKGVMIEQRNMCNYLNANDRHPTIYWHTQDIRMALAVTSISFDMSITERFVPLYNGVPVCMATVDEIHNPLALGKLMKENHTESIVCTPSYLTSLLDEPEMLPEIARLKAFHVGGEAFPQTLTEKLKKLNPCSHVMNGYGPTETTVSSSSCEMQPGKHVTIGKPEANVRYYVMDKQLRQVPPGVCGELIICGMGVGRGYVKLPERTAAAFFEFNGSRAYHSGDLVRLNVDGEYDYYGRLDNQVKLRGLRIELDEIETVMNEYPGMKLSKVIVRNNGKEDYLAGFYTAEKEISPKELKAFLKTRLTPYMIPDAMVQLSEMPLTVNGKIDKKKLPETKDLVKMREYTPPASELEKLFCEIFAKVLKTDRVGATDNFFEIGGTSLSAAMVVSHAVRQGLDLVYKNIFDNATPRLLAEFLERGKQDPVPEAEIIQSGSEEKVHEGALRFNRSEYLNEISTSPLGTVLLTGATGFLGIHILKELLHDSGTDRIICLTRHKKKIDANKRIRVFLEYYFSRTYDDLLDSKVMIVDGDILDDNIAELLPDVKIDTIINCAALVKHFEEGDLIRKIDYEGVLRLIELALEKEAKLVQVSTLSIAGTVEAKGGDPGVLFENICDMGQTPGTKYSVAKLDAEKAVLEAIENRGLRAKIMRVGNLMGRRSDGEFQINFRTNGFMSRLKAYKLLGCFPVDMMDSLVELSPVDVTAKAILLLSGTPDKFTVFHANNWQQIHFSYVLEELKKCGYPIEVVDRKEFDKRYLEAMTDDEKGIAISSLSSYNLNAAEKRIRVRTDNSFTIKALYRLGFSWPVVENAYLYNLITALAGLGFFEE